MELRTNIEKHRGFLIERLDPDHGLLDELKLSYAEIIEIKYNQNPIQRSKTILEYILEKSSCTEFIDALNNSKQRHVANFILGNGEYKDEYGGNWPLTDNEIRTLDANRKALIDDMEAESGLLDSLFSKNVINIRQKESINPISSRHGKVEVLLEMLRRCSLNDYRLTIECFHESNQSHIARILEQGRDEVVDEVLKQIENDLKKVEACLTEGKCKRNKLRDRKRDLLKAVENTEGVITQRAAELKQLIDQQMISLLDDLSVVKEEKLNELENEEQKYDAILSSFENLKKYLNELKDRRSSDDIYHSTKEAQTRAGDLEKTQKSLFQRQIPSVTVSFRFSNVEEFENIVGKIEVQSELSPLKEKKVIVVGLCDEAWNVSNEMFECDLDRPNEISNLQSVPSYMYPMAVAVTYGENLYVIGIGKEYDEIWKFGRNSGWTRRAYLDQEREGHCVSIVGTSFYICGGCHPRIDKVLKSVEVYDLLTNKCSTVGELVHGVKYSACAIHNGLIYVFGGRLEANISTDYVQRYNPRDNTCSLFSKPMPSPESHLRALS